MVQSPAPKARPFHANDASYVWTNRFRRASASRLKHQVSIVTLASSAFLFSGSLSTRSEANPPGLSPVFSSQAAVSRSVATSSVAPSIVLAATAEASEIVAPSVANTPVENTPVVTPAEANSIAPSAITAPVASAFKSTKSAAPVLQIDAAGMISAQMPSSQTVSSQTVSPQPLSSQPATLAIPASPQSSQLQSQPVPAPQLGARGKTRPVTSGSAAKSAVQNATSPLAVTKMASSPDSDAASRSKALEVAPKIQVRAVVSGKEQQAQIAVTPKMTVGQALAAMGVSLAILDRVTPDAAALVRDGLTMRVTRIGSQVRTSRKAIPAELRYQPTTSIRAGAKSTIQEAKAGTLEITERVWTRDGKVTKREFVSQRVAAQPQHKIVALGVNSHLMPNNVRPHRRYAKALSYRGGTPRDRMLAPADPRTFAPIKSMKVMATGYSAGPAGGAIGNWTATGVRCTYGAVAVDPRLIPLGSRLYIEGYGYGFACDTGGAIKGKHIDLAFDSPRAAFRHGKRQMKVWILGR